MKNYEMKKLKQIKLAPWIQKATRLRQKPRHVGGNQFRHQGKTLFILIDYLIIDSVLLKASLIHDLFEEFTYDSFDDLIYLDEDGYSVVQLVLEVTRRKIKNGDVEPKEKFLRRIKNQGSRRAKLLKCADRISNLTDLNSDFDNKFIKRYMEESRKNVLPMAKEVNQNMYIELKDIMTKLEKATGIKVL